MSDVVSAIKSEKDDRTRNNDVTLDNIFIDCHGRQVHVPHNICTTCTHSEGTGKKTKSCTNLVGIVLGVDLCMCPKHFVLYMKDAYKFSSSTSVLTNAKKAKSILDVI